jgi:hypothetical protein
LLNFAFRRLIYISENSATDFWERLFDDERRGQPQWSLTVEPETLFEVLKGISEGEIITWRTAFNIWSRFLDSPPIVMCVERGAHQRKKEICSWVTAVLHSSTLPW